MGAPVLVSHSVERKRKGAHGGTPLQDKAGAPLKPRDAPGLFWSFTLLESTKLQGLTGNRLYFHLRGHLDVGHLDIDRGYFGDLNVWHCDIYGRNLDVRHRDIHCWIRWKRHSRNNDLAPDLGPDDCAKWRTLFRCNPHGLLRLISDEGDGDLAFFLGANNARYVAR